MKRQITKQKNTLSEQAAQWIIMMDDQPLQLLEKEQLLTWLRLSPLHIDEFLLASAMWSELDGLDNVTQVNIEQLIAEAQRPVVPLNIRQDTISPSSFRGRWLVGIAATLLVSVAVLFSIQSDNTHFSTAVGEQLTFNLSDGSIVQLNTDSEIETMITENKREIKLLRGEAMFTVAKDASRPFKVISNSIIIQALGTQFNVYQRNNSTSVAVIEGRVSVLSKDTVKALETNTNVIANTFDKGVVFTAGEEVIALQSGKITRIDTPNIEKSVAWQNRRLVFQRDTLATITAEFNRYNQRKLIILNDEIRSRTLTATFNADDPESLASFLERDDSIEVIRQDQKIIISKL